MTATTYRNELMSPHCLFDLLPIHTVVNVTTEFGGEYRLMWRGYGRFTNLDTGSEWFVENLPTMTMTIPSFTIEV